MRLDDLVILHRKMLDWEWMDDPITVWLWVKFLLMANNKETKWQGRIIKRGQLVTTYSQLVRKKATLKCIRNALKKLEDGKYIVTQRAPNGTIVTICDYEDYQDVINSLGQSTGSQRAPLKERKKETNKESTKENKKEINKEKNLSSFSTENNELIKTCAEKPKPSRKKIPEEYTLVHKARLLFVDFYKREYDMEYGWDAKEAALMKRLLDKLTFARKSKNMPIDDESLLGALDSFLNAIQSNFVKESFDIGMLVSQYNKIVSQIQYNLNQKKYGNTTTSAADAERQKASNVILKALERNKPVESE